MYYTVSNKEIVVKKDDLIKEWEQRASDYLRLAQIGESAPPHHSHLHDAAKDQRARSETYTYCVKELRERC